MWNDDFTRLLERGSKHFSEPLGGQLACILRVRARSGRTEVTHQEVALANALTRVFRREHGAFAVAEAIARRLLVGA
jgi:hypothetical protein